MSCTEMAQKIIELEKELKLAKQETTAYRENENYLLANTEAQYHRICYLEQEREKQNYAISDQSEKHKQEIMFTALAMAQASTLLAESLQAEIKASRRIKELKKLNQELTDSMS